MPRGAECHGKRTDELGQTNLGIVARPRVPVPIRMSGSQSL